MKKKTKVCIASLLAVGMNLNVCLPQLFGATATAADVQTNTIQSVDDGTTIGKPAFKYAGMSNTAYKSEDVADVIDKVWTYWTENKYTTGWDWLTATYHLGNLEAYKATGKSKYYDQTYDIAEAYGWRVNNGNDTTFLDAVCTSQVYCMLHSLTSDEDDSVNYKLTGANGVGGVQDILDYNYKYGMVDYSWVDEIYMAGFSHTYLSQVTGDSKYTDIDFDTYMYYRERFLDEETGLWYRDWQFVPGKDCNFAEQYGEKTLWGRGNTWVYVTLAQRMEYMDKDDPAYETYKNDFLMMSKGLVNARIKDENGNPTIWGANLGDTTKYPGMEMTGTGGFLYGMCVGIELGLLDESYVDVVQTAYDTITTKCITADGFVGYCQPPAGSPSSYNPDTVATNTVNYGVGLTVMGLSRFMRLCGDYADKYEAPTLTAEWEDFNADNATFAVLDTDWYKGVMVASTSSANVKEYTDYPNNGIENVVNGNWKSENEGASFRCNGLTSGVIVVDIAFAEEVTLKKIGILLQASYAYNYKIELYNVETNAWVEVAKTTESEFVYQKIWDFKDTVGTVKCDKARITFGKYYDKATRSLLWVREVLFYEV